MCWLRKGEASRGPGCEGRYTVQSHTPKLELRKVALSKVNFGSWKESNNVSTAAEVTLLNHFH